ncbi:MAG: sigma-70 family RNA polymerase sigma factor [Gemmataceae bacterium]|nr:sigma-70 family RNA polymerase sigma factor [Gemmataceae bacterium]
MAHRPVSLLLRHIRKLTGVHSPPTTTDGQLLERFSVQRDDAAFETLVERYGPVVLGLCRRVLQNSQDAEDAFQATFLVLARKAGSIRKQESVGSWLYGVAYRISLEAKVRVARRRAHETRVGDMRPIDFRSTDDETTDGTADIKDFRTSDPSTEAAWRELQPMLDDELSRLPEKYRAPVILCYLQGKTNEEAAAQLAWPVGSVKGRLSRARDLLRDRLGRRGVALSAGALAMLLADHATAFVPSSLRVPTIQSAAAFAAGQATASAEVIALAEGAIKAMSFNKLRTFATLTLLVGLTGAGLALHSLAAEPKDAVKAPPALIRSAQSGPWSAPGTWEGGKVPPAASRVQVRPAHTVVYDINSDQVIRSIHVAGTLRFAVDKDTRLDVGLIKIQAGDDASENGFDCDAHMMDGDDKGPKPALVIGTADKPLDAKYTARIRLTEVDGLDKQACPAIVCCGGRMDLHGAPLSRTWVKLGADAKANDSDLTLSDAVTGWRVGDRLIITATKLGRAGGGTSRPGSKNRNVQTEERTIKAIAGDKLTLDKPLEFDHLGSGDYRGEVANLSRNVIVESADPAKERGHTMYHRYSAGSISYAEFRHLGKENILGKYAIHYHLVGDTMRGSSLIGASIWDSHNRWVTIHGTNYLVVRDNVGYQSVGHGFFMEDGTEVYNVLDRNLAVQAYLGKALPKQVLPFDHNEGAGFWWANSLNTFTRNVAVENDRYGYRYEATKTSAFNLTLNVLHGDGERKAVDIRTLPFVRFDDNECHCDGLYGFNLGEGVARVGPDAKHPFIVRNMKIWAIHYAFRPQVPSLLVENLKIHKAAYGVYHPNYDNHVYRDVLVSQTNTEPFNRGHDDDSIQYGSLTVDGLTFDGIRSGRSMPLIQISDDNPTGAAVSHFRNVKTANWSGTKDRAIVNLGGGPRPTPKSEKGVPVYLHDWFGKGMHAKVMSTKAKELKTDGLQYREEALLTGDESRVAEVKDVEFPKLLDPVDDLPPTTVILSVKRDGSKVIVRGCTADNGVVKKVIVNGQPATSLAPNFADWEVVLENVKSGEMKLEAHAEDAAGNVEKKPHVLTVTR